MWVGHFVLAVLDGVIDFDLLSLWAVSGTSRFCIISLWQYVDSCVRIRVERLWFAVLSNHDQALRRRQAYRVEVRTESGGSSACRTMVRTWRQRFLRRFYGKCLKYRVSLSVSTRVVVAALYASTIAPEPQHLRWSAASSWAYVRTGGRTISPGLLSILDV